MKDPEKMTPERQALFVTAALESARDRRDRLDREVKEMAEQIMRDLRRVIARVDAGETCNELGELQSRGPGFDRLVALRGEAHWEAERWERFVGRLQLPTIEDLSKETS